MASTGEPFGLFWNSENGDRTYDASSFEYWLKKFFTSGVFEGDLQVQATSGMTLKVGSGYANVDGKVRFWNAEFNLTLSPANSTYPRIDTVVITRDNVNRNITCEVVTGAYSGDTPQPTAPVRTAEIYQLVLAQIYVGNGVTEITQANITDTRQNTELCGYITGTVTEMDFSQFVAQFESYFAQFKSQHEHDWSVWEQTQVAAYNAWFATVQAQQVADKADWDAWYAALQEELHNLPADTAEYLQIQIDEIRDNGTTGSIFHITTTNTELEGKTVTVSCGTEVRTATFDANLECTVIGFKSVGAVTITSTDGIQTATRVLNIDYYSKYEVPIAFWSATVNIQGDDNLKGATITVKDSDDLTVGTVVLNVITGRGVFTAQKADTYSFNFTYQGTDYSESLVVDEETTYSLSLSAGFNWHTWVDTARFLDSTDYNSLDEVLADEEAVRELCLEHACVDYLARVASATADIETIINNDLFAKWVNNSDYSLDVLGANVAIKALMDTADKYGYGEWVLMPQVPKMTSNTAPYGTVTRSSIYNSSWESWKAFDGDESTRWIAAADGDTQYIEYEFTNAVCISQYYFKLNDLSNAQTKYGNIYLKAYDGSTYQILDTIVASSLTSAEVRKSISNTQKYTKYRIEYTKVTSGDDGFVTIQFYAYAPKGNVPVMTSNTAPYGEVVGSSVLNSGTYYYSAFDGDESSVWHSAAGMPQYIGYKATNPMKLKACRVVVPPVSTSYPNTKETFKIQGSNDGFVNDVHDLTEPQEIAFRTDGICSVLWVEVDSEDYYLHHRVYVTDSTYQSASYKYAQFREIQFYGRELSVSVPTMTGNTTPYGVASASSEATTSSISYAAYQAFSSDSAHGWVPAGGQYTTSDYLRYQFVSPMMAKKAHVLFMPYNQTRSFKYKIQGSNTANSNDWTDVSDEIQLTAPAGGTYEANISLTSSQEYLYYQFVPTTSDMTLNAYGLKLQLYGLDYSEKEFEAGTTKKWLYDHGVELETLTNGTSGTGTVTKEDSQVVMQRTSSSSIAHLNLNSLDLSDYNVMRSKVGAKMYGPSGSNPEMVAQNIAYISFNDGNANLPNNIGLDVSSANQSTELSLGIGGAGNGTYYVSFTEWWLE